MADTRDLERARDALDDVSMAIDSAIAQLQDNAEDEDEDPDADKPTLPCVRCGIISKTADCTVLHWRSGNDGIDRVCSACAVLLRAWMTHPPP